MNTFYNYRHAIIDSIKSVLPEYIDMNRLQEYLGNDRSFYEKDLCDRLKIDNRVMKYDSKTAMENLEGNLSLASEALYFLSGVIPYDVSAQSIGIHFMERDYEWFDRMIRYYLLDECIAEVFDEIAENG